MAYLFENTIFTSYRYDMYEVCYCTADIGNVKLVSGSRITFVRLHLAKKRMRLRLQPYDL
jgi:hypothetical protein